MLVLLWRHVRKRAGERLGHRGLRMLQVRARRAGAWRCLRPDVGGRRGAGRPVGQDGMRDGRQRAVRRVRGRQMSGRCRPGLE
jgi:hypothetical protein